MQVFAIWSHIAETSIEIEADLHFHPYIIHLDISSSRPYIDRSLERVPEIRILDIGQIVKSMRVGIDYSPIRLSLGSDLSLVPPDQQYPGSQDDADKARVEAQVNIERVDVSRGPGFPE
jgi:hypothetical protein